MLRSKTARHAGVSNHWIDRLRQARRQNPLQPIRNGDTTITPLQPRRRLVSRTASNDVVTNDGIAPRPSPRTRSPEPFYQIGIVTGSITIANPATTYNNFSFAAELAFELPVAAGWYARAWQHPQARGCLRASPHGEHDRSDRVALRRCHWRETPLDHMA